MRSQTKIIVRYAETDKMGIVHHSNYAIWFEAARTDFTKLLGLTYTQMEEMGVATPLIELHCSYKKPAFYEDELIIEAWPHLVTPVKLGFRYQVIRSSTNEVLCTGSTLHALVGKGLKIVNVRKEFPALYEKFLSAQENDEKDNSL